MPKVNPNHTRITEEGTKECLNEYARISAVELFEQISVQYSADVYPEFELVLEDVATLTHKH